MGKGYSICCVCGVKQATDAHHLFSQTKQNKKLYSDYIHDYRNLVPVCNDCHMTKPLPKMSEIEFCERVGIEPRGKTLKFKRRKI